MTIVFAYKLLISQMCKKQIINEEATAKQRPPEKSTTHLLARRMLAHDILHAVKTVNSVDLLPTLQKILNRYTSYMHWNTFFFTQKVNEFKNHKKKLRLYHEYTNQNANYINNSNNKKMNSVCTFFFACSISFTD